MKTNAAQRLIDISRSLEVQMAYTQHYPPWLLANIVQVALAITILALTINLTIRYQSLKDSCRSPPHTQQCENIAFALGALKYNLVPPAWALISVSMWLVDSFIIGLPWVIVSGFEWMAQGFYMGAGCTLAAKLNSDWNCKAGDGGALRLCDQLYADTALNFFAILVTWAQVYGQSHFKSVYVRVDSDV